MQCKSPLTFLSLSFSVDVIVRSNEFSRRNSQLATKYSETSTLLLCHKITNGTPGLRSSEKRKSN